jgi:hypothetical protein
MIDKSDAISSLRPGAEWILRGDNIEWLDQNQSQPSDSEIAAEMVRLQSIAESKAYQRKRAVEYPPMSDYLDGIVKGDQAQVQAYIDACLAIKAKYPKG